jgi:hypothetical protein
MRLLALLLSALLAGCAIFDGDDDPPPAPPVLAAGITLDPRDPANWQIGPVIDGEQISVGVPLRPLPHPEGWWFFDFPQAGGSVHYVTMPVGPLAGYSRVVLRYRVEAAPGVRIVPRTAPDSPSMLTPYLERRGLRWTSTYEAWRWFAAFARQSPIMAGEFLLDVPLAGPWSAAMSTSNPDASQAALQDTGRLGMVFGGGDGAGHGAYATGPARFVLLELRVE